MILLPVGTRAELVKMSSLIHALEKRGADYKFINLNQHQLTDTIKLMGLPEPHVTVPLNLREQWKALGPLGLRKWYVEGMKTISGLWNGTNAIMGHGNTFGMRMAMHARQKLGTKSDRSVHVEAGVRAFFPIKPDFNNWRRARFADFMYRVGDRTADVNVAVFRSSLENLRKEKTRGKSVYTQDPVVEIVKSALAKKSSVSRRGIFVAANATRSIDSKKKAEAVIRGIERSGVRVVYVINPKIQTRLQKYKLLKRFTEVAEVQPALNYVDFLHLVSRAATLITDSNSTQEECAVLRKPCIVTNDFAQFPELVDSKNVRVVGCSADGISKALQEAVHKKFVSRYNIGDGKATERIVNLVEDYI